MKDFSLKFLDIMIGIVLGLGLQWWPELNEPWQYIAFLFVYVDIIDYWIDYGPSLKRFPPQREIDVMLDVAIMLTLFFYIYSTQLSILNFFTVFVVWRAFDYLWLWSSKREYQPTGITKVFVDTWMRFDIAEAVFTAILIAVGMFLVTKPLVLLVAYIAFRVAIRIFASLRYKKVHFI